MTIPHPHDRTRNLHFSGWATTASKQPDGSYEAQVKACYTERSGNVFASFAMRSVIYKKGGFPETNSARRHAREVRAQFQAFVPAGFIYS
jgi:hypothetical protein